jgi:D-alanine-D-alanine ligase-like ATP-grasp enzyme
VSWSPPARLVVVRDAPRPHPLAWIHRAEAQSIVDELRGAECNVSVERFGADTVRRLRPGPLLLRLSDPVMLDAARALTDASIPYVGPSADAMARCYDKYAAWRIASAAGIDCPATALARDADTLSFPLFVKPRRGSDSIGVRLLRRGPITPRRRTDGFIAQERIVGAELTIAVLQGRIGRSLQIFLPEGTPYSFMRKYFWRPARAPVADASLAGRVRDAAERIASALHVDWAARIDFIHERDTGRLRFLECDVAPLVGARSAFAASLAAAGIGRAEQLRLLLDSADEVLQRGGMVQR